MKDLTLVVMAAGMGSRFGGPKQITPIGPSGEFIIDYSVYDAIKAGFTKVIFIIKKEHRQVFDETITKNLKDKIQIEYVYQELTNVPSDVVVPKDRVKPWGTTHAILSAEELITTPFAIINADDFYGRDAYQKAADFLLNSQDENTGAVISYPYIVTSSKYGSVKRAVIEERDGFITDLIESKIETVNNKAMCEPLNMDEPFEKELDIPVSMNLFCFKPNFLKLLKQDFNEFIHQDEQTLLTGEALLPDVARKAIKSGELKLKNIVTTAKWSGVTYKEDLPELKQTISSFVGSGEYPRNLWND